MSNSDQKMLFVKPISPMSSDELKDLRNALSDVAKVSEDYFFVIMPSIELMSKGDLKTYLERMLRLISVSSPKNPNK